MNFFLLPQTLKILRLIFFSNYLFDIIFLNKRWKRTPPDNISYVFNMILPCWTYSPSRGVSRLVFSKCFEIVDQKNKTHDLLWQGLWSSLCYKYKSIVRKFEIHNSLRHLHSISKCFKSQLIFPHEIDEVIPVINKMIIASIKPVSDS